jgi:2-polyprenyl-6-methoxyphenol hydroxylase-like FAD-dependent oxidoreductase
MTKKPMSPQSAAPRALVAGASFAGLSTAFWLQQLGYQVTVVEIADSVKKGGTPVDIKDGTIDVARRMGILDDIRSHRLAARTTEFKAPDGSTLAVQPPDADNGFEIDRDVLLDILFKKIADKVEIHFGTTITGLQDGDDAACVTFADGSADSFALVVGCDGNHSTVRRMHFGEEAQFSHFLDLYFSISIIDKPVVPADTTHIFSVPGKTVMLNSYENKTDVVFCFHAAQALPYDRRDEHQQRRIVQERFAGMGWLVPVLLDDVAHADNFYFDKMCQIKMPCWTKGRVALVGDAAYCASPAAGMGGSLAIVGATALADALQRYPHDLTAAFTAYQEGLSPFIDEVQAGAIQFGLDMFVPKTEAALQARNERLLAE